MKIFSLENQILAGFIASANGDNGYIFSNAMEAHKSIFVTVPNNLWASINLSRSIIEVLKARYPKKWSTWKSKKSEQFLKLGEQLKRPYNRCGTDKS